MAKKLTFKRILAMILAIMMLTGIMQLTVFADGATGATAQVAGYTTHDHISSGKVAEADVNSSGSSISHEDGSIVLTKSITKSTDDPTAFTISLQVATTKTVTEIQNKNKVALQLVIDCSGSMNYCATCGKEDCKKQSHGGVSRLAAVKSSIAAMLGSFPDDADILVSVISFNEGATRVCDWTSNMTDVSNAVNRLSANEGTNMEAGLMLARNRLGMEQVKDRIKYTILLSDGAPTYHNDTNDYVSTVSISHNGWNDGGTSTHQADYQDIPAIAAEIRALGKLYTICYGAANDTLYTSNHTTVTVGQFLDSIADHNYPASDAAEVNAAFAFFGDAIINEMGTTGEGAVVEDPMGSYITLTPPTYDGVTSTASQIEWTLDPDNATTTDLGNGQTQYTYTIQYTIHLDTSAQGFDESALYATNGRTYITIGENEYDFPIPVVKGTVPTVPYSIEFYLQDEASINGTPTYTLQSTDTVTGSGKLWTSVDAPVGYATKYASRHYSFASGDTQMVLRDGENVMKLYYKLDTKTVTVNHFYTTNTWNADGTFTAGEYPADPQSTGSFKVVTGSSYDVSNKVTLTYGGNTYAKDEETKNTDECFPASLSGTANDDVTVDLYYVREVDERAVTSAEVKHEYITKEYKLDNGTYVIYIAADVTEDNAQSGSDLRATTRFGVSAAPLSGYQGYTLTSHEGVDEIDGQLSFVLAADPDQNVRTLVFVKEVDNRPDEVTVTVNHHYTKSVTTVVNGTATTTTTENDGESVTVTKRPGESFTATEINTYADETYTSDAGNAAKLNITVSENGNVIDLYYTLTVAPETGSIAVQHIYRTITETTVEVLDEDGNVTGTDVEVSTDSETVPGDALTGYIGESRTAPLVGREGYIFNENESTDTGVIGTDDMLTLVYDKTETDDVRDDASIDVQHIYTTHLITVVDGAVTTIDVSDGEVKDPATTGKAGDPFTATTVTTYDGKDYTVVGDPTLSVILQKGTNSTIVINYERTVDDRVSTSYAVKYEYRDYTMTVNEAGKAGYWNDPEVTTEDGASEADRYVGEQITVADGARDGYTACTTNPATVQILVEDPSANVYTFVYERYTALPKGTVTVNHHYTTTTIAANGEESSETQDVAGEPVEAYVGESFPVNPVLNGFELTAMKVNGAVVEVLSTQAAEEPAAYYTLTVTEGGTTVDFYYDKVDDQSVAAQYSITHTYNIYDYDGTPISSSTGDPKTGTGYLGNPITENPDTGDGFTLVSVTRNGSEALTPDANGSYTFNLLEGANDVAFVYQKTLPPDTLDVNVIHNYYASEEAMNAEEPVTEACYEESQEALEGSDFTATRRPVPADGGLTYTFVSAEPAETITVTENGERTIIMNYVRASASYTVTHVYLTNGTEDGRTSETFTGTEGETIAAADIKRVTEYAGNTYEFESATADIVLSSAEAKNITLTYTRTYSDPTPPPYYPPADPTPTPDPDPDPTEIPEDDVPLSDTPTEIPEDDVPLSDTPVEIPEDDVPLGDQPGIPGFDNTPKTGDNAHYRFWVIVSLLSGLGLIVLGFDGRKRSRRTGR